MIDALLYDGGWQIIATMGSAIVCIAIAFGCVHMGGWYDP